MDMDENAEDCAKRELKEETGLEVGTMRRLVASVALCRDLMDMPAYFVTILG